MDLRIIILMIWNILDYRTISERPVVFFQQRPHFNFRQEWDSVANLNTPEILRPGTVRELSDNANTKLGEKGFCISAARLWNSAPKLIKDSTTLRQAKRNIKDYCKKVPV